MSYVAVIFYPLLLTLLLYISVSPRFAQSLYRGSLFYDKDATPSNPALIDAFSWDKKYRQAIKAQDGTVMHSWLFAKETEYLAIYYIGRSSCVSNCLPAVNHLLMAGYSVLIAEYRGFGETPGKPSVDSICTDGLTIFDHAVQCLGYTPAKIVVLGESLGGGVASYVAKARQPGGIILKNTFASLPAIGRDKVPLVRIYPDWMYPANHLQIIDWLSDWTGPLLVVHAEHDQTVPFVHGAEIFEAVVSKRKKRFLALPKSTHRQITDQSEAAQFIGEARRMQTSMRSSKIPYGRY